MSARYILPIYVLMLGLCWKYSAYSCCRLACLLILLQLINKSDKEDLIAHGIKSTFVTGGNTEIKKLWSTKRQ